MAGLVEMRILIVLGVFLCQSLTGAWADSFGQTKEQILSRGYLKCGVGIDDTGFSKRNIDGQWTGFDVDFCRAIAAAVLGDATAVDFIPLDSSNRLDVLQREHIDVLFRTTTYTFKRDMTLGFDFPAITFYDSQKILAHASENIKNLDDLAGKTICANLGTTSLTNISAILEKHDIPATILEVSSQAGRWRAFFGRECEAVTADGSDLFARITNQPFYQDNFTFLNEELANEPLGPVVRDGDQEWVHIIRWVINFMVLSEHYGIGQTSDLSSLAALKLPSGKKFGLQDSWAADVLNQVGHYGEVYDRNLGEDSALKIPRGFNKLWREGGLQYPLPMHLD